MRNKFTDRRAPVERASGFHFDDFNQAKRAFKHLQQKHEQKKYLKPPIYTRYGNPSVSSAEKAIKKLEGCEWVVLTSSGMSAIDVALSIFPKKQKNAKNPRNNPWLFFSDIYGGTKGYIEKILKEYHGITVDYFPYEQTKGFRIKNEKFDLEKLKARLDEVKPAVLFLESISNPLLIVPDMQEIVGYAKKFGTKVVVDNTFATPLLWNPLSAKDDSAPDLIIHSTTKYLGGHGNLTAGVVCGNDSELYEEALEYRKLTGCILSPDDAYRLETQLLTLDLRFKRQCENAFELATFLNEKCSDKVSVVRYPGLPDHPTFTQASELFSPKAEKNGFGAMITFELKGWIGDEGGYEDLETDNQTVAHENSCRTFIDAVNRDEICPVHYVPTLGDAQSILLHASSVFTKNEPHLPHGMIRFSVGCEPVEDLKKSLRQALDAVELKK
ncbi:MAG TPA: PLP-dependent aspartate aminotransferase family protein [Pyrinomonadaceae bacterium]|jgi:cystathionine beta-lyase/cystathionine gamma-synthase